MIRYYLSLIPEAFKLVWAHVNVAENLAERANRQRAVAMDRHDCIRLVASEHLVTPANANHSESLALKKTQQILAADARELSHEQLRSNRVRESGPVDG